MRVLGYNGGMETHALLGEAVEWLRRLVAHNTESALPNTALVEEVRVFLANVGANVTVALDETGSKATLFATLGPQVDGGVALSGHSDVVDATRQEWRTPPFELSERGGRLFARGACDMKGFVACVLAAAPAFAQAPLRKPVHIALSRDEEIGVLGMPQMLEVIRDSGPRPAVAIVGEPTEMQIVAGHKAGRDMVTVFHGRAAHSSMPAEGCCANVPAARFVLFLEELNREMAAKAREGSLFSPPYGVVNPGLVRGGTGKNVVSARCEVAWHYRPLPDEDGEEVVARARRFAMEEVLPAMRAGGHSAWVEFLQESAYPGLTPDESSPALALARRLLGREDFAVAPYGADAGYFQQAGIAAVIVGPGSIAQAHKPDEFVETAQLVECLRFLDRLRERLASGD